MLANLIKSVPDYQTKTAAEITSAINAETIPVIDSQMYTWAGVALIAGPTGAEGLRLALEGNGMGWVVHQLGGSGLQLSDALSQQVLIGFAQAGVPGCAELAWQGKHFISMGAQAGLGVVTEASVASLVSVDLAKESMMSLGANRWNAFVDAIDVWDGSGSGPVL